MKSILHDLDNTEILQSNVSCPVEYMDEEEEVGSAPLLHITFISNHLAPLGFSATALFTPFESA